MPRSAPGTGPTELELHPRMQRLTMEIILRAVFGLDPGERLDALRDRLARLAAYGDKPITLLGQPPEWLEPALNRFGPVAGFLDLRAETDALLFEQIAERRADPGERDDILSILLEARHEDETPMCQQELRDELLTLLIAGHETTATTLAWAFERLVREPARARSAGRRDRRRGRRRVPHGDDPRDASPPAGAPERRARVWSEADRGRGLELRAGGLPGPERLPRPPRPATSIRTRTRSALSGCSTSRPGPTPGSRSAAGAGAASGPASRCSR